MKMKIEIVMSGDSFVVDPIGEIETMLEAIRLKMEMSGLTTDHGDFLTLVDSNGQKCGKVTIK